MPNMKHYALFLVTLIGSLTAHAPQNQFADSKIGVQNSILAKVNGHTISVLDVKKRMDMVFYQHYPQYAENTQARFQFYQTGWRNVLMEMIDNELILADAEDKEVKVTDGDVREVVEERFGPNVMQTLDQIGLAYDEAWKIIKNEQIVGRMNWWFVQSKAIGSVTPQAIRQSYQLYLEQNPPYTDWTYRVVSIRPDHPEASLPELVYEFLSTQTTPPDNLVEELARFESAGASITVSNEFSATDQELSDLHKTALLSLKCGEYSRPSLQTNRTDKKPVYRIFYLTNKNEHPAPAFEDLAQQLQNQLVQEASLKASKDYTARLRKFYDFDPAKVIPEDIQPFSLQ